MCGDEARFVSERIFVSKLDVILVHVRKWSCFLRSGWIGCLIACVLMQVLKQEWPHNWPSFIEEFVGASKTSELLCENNMDVLKLLRWGGFCSVAFVCTVA